MTTPFKALWAGLTPKEKSRLAEDADTSVAYLFQVANGHRRAGTKTIGNLVSADNRISYDMFFSQAESSTQRQQGQCS